jgi:hypothetical protein
MNSQYHQPVDPSPTSAPSLPPIADYSSQKALALAEDSHLDGVPAPRYWSPTGHSVEVERRSGTDSVEMRCHSSRYQKQGQIGETAECNGPYNSHACASLYASATRWLLRHQG